MFRAALLSAMVFAVLPMGAAYGQIDELRSEATRQITEFCAAAPEMASMSDAQRQCECAAQIIIEPWGERELALFTRVFAYYPDREAARAELRRMTAESDYTEAEFVAVGERFSSTADVVSANCGDRNRTRVK